MAKKIKTNEQMLKALYKDLSMFEAAVLRERLLKIAELTLRDLKERPETYENPLLDAQIYKSVSDKINKHLGTD